jgi:SAM-dependent methyltransferase
LGAQAQGRVNIPYADAKPVFDALRADLLPPEFRDKTAAEREAAWPEWITRRDADIRARLAAGDEDSIVNFLLYGTTFTSKPRPNEREVAELVTDTADALKWLRPRTDDFVAALASPGMNERLQFARDVVRRHGGIDPATAAGRIEAQRYLEERTVAMSASGALRTRTLLDASGTELSDRLTLFRERGLSSDTSILIDFGIEKALEDLKSNGLLKPASVLRVAIVGPGLDFTDKQEGHAFYPQQTIQPFAVIDSLMRLGLAAPGGVQVTACDLSPRVIQHLEAARTRARQGSSYTLVLPRELDRRWTADLTRYWQRFGDRIGKPATPVLPPPAAGRLDVRAVTVSPPVVLALTPRDLNVVVQRLDPLPAAEQFDLVLATNILLYYDVFEQSLAVTNVAKMLRPGGIFLTNDRLFDLPSSPIRSAGSTNVVYLEQPGAAVKGDRIAWYQR